MPVHHHPEATSIDQEKCKLCDESVNKPNEKAVECDICEEWVCLPCSGISGDVYKLVSESDCNIDFLCKPCKGELPRIKEIIILKQKQIEIIENIRKDAEINKKFREEQRTTNEDLNRRLVAVEKVVRDKKLDDKEFPPLQRLTEDARNLQFVISQQKKLDVEVKQQRESNEEHKRRVDKENSLIVFGIPERPTNQKDEIMRADFETIKQMYSAKVNLIPTDLIQISRIGKDQTTNKVRPIRLTFHNPEKRSEILRNNKNLIIEGEELPQCSEPFCDDQESHHNNYLLNFEVLY